MSRLPRRPYVDDLAAAHARAEHLASENAALRARLGRRPLVMRTWIDWVVFGLVAMIIAASVVTLVRVFVPGG